MVREVVPYTDMKIDAITYDMKKITIRGPTSLSIASETDFISESISIATRVLPTAIENLPKKEIRDPIPFATKKLPECLRAREKAFIAEEQKFSPVRATWI
jgi:hypothetical protein